MNKDYNAGEFAADELEEGQYRYETEAVRNQYPQNEDERNRPFGRPPVKPRKRACGGCGGMCGGEDTKSPDKGRDVNRPPKDGVTKNELYPKDGDQPYSGIAGYKMIPDPFAEENENTVNTSGS